MNRIPLAVTEKRINKPPIDAEQYRVDAPGSSNGENRPPKDIAKK
jgi:hypothetical protein